MPFIPRVCKWLAAAAAVVSLIGIAAPASAQVRYDFTAFSSFPFGNDEGPEESFSGSFSVILPDFVSTDTTLAVESLLSCNVVASPAADALCRQQRFLFDISEGYVTVSFGVSTTLNPGTGIYYYFNDDAFSTVGLHESQLFGASQAGTLLVTAVPEPASWAAMLLGLTGIGVALRRRNRR